MLDWKSRSNLNGLNGVKGAGRSCTGEVQQQILTFQKILTIQASQKYSHLNNYELVLADDLRIAKKKDSCQRRDNPGVDMLDLGVPKPTRKRPRLGPVLKQRFNHEPL